MTADHALQVQLPVDPPDLPAESARILLEILLDVREDTEGMSASGARIALRQLGEETVGR